MCDGNTYKNHYQDTNNTSKNVAKFAAQWQIIFYGASKLFPRYVSNAFGTKKSQKKRETASKAASRFFVP